MMQTCFPAHENDLESMAKGCREIANASEAKQKKDQENCINYLTNLANKELEEKDKQIKQEQKTSHDASCKTEGRYTQCKTHQGPIKSGATTNGRERSTGHNVGRSTGEDID